MQINLGNILKQNEPVFVNGIEMDSTALYVKAIELNPTETMPYINLGILLEQGGAVLVNNITMTTRTLWAIESKRNIWAVC